MADKTGIEWTDASWNPVVGCSIVSPGCTNCYAMTMAGRIEAMGTAPHYAGTTQVSKAGAIWTGKLALAPDHIVTQPLRWKRPRRIFVNSMGDLFHEDVPDEWIDRVFAVMALCPQHTFQILTKRSARMRRYIEAAFDRIVVAMMQLVSEGWPCVRHKCESLRIPYRQVTSAHDWYPMRNVWLGVSAEDQRRADERIPDLLATPAVVRFVSAEPLLGPIDFRSSYGGTLWIGGQRGCDGTHRHDGRAGEVIHGIVHQGDPRHPHHHHDDRCAAGLDWIIVGGESGKGARPMHPHWARSIRDQCAVAGTAFFFKQWGEWSPHTAALEDETGSIRTSPRGGVNWQSDKPGGAFGVFRVGKHRAGRLLDGAEHNAMPVAP